MLKNLCKAAIYLVMASVSTACSVLDQYVQKPTVQFEDVQYRSVSLQQGMLDSRIQISNPNAFTIPVRSILYSLKLNERELVNSSLAFDKSIPANGSIKLQVPIHFKYAEVLNGISSIIQNRNIKFQLAGEVDFGVIQIPFSRTGDFALHY